MRTRSNWANDSRTITQDYRAVLAPGSLKKFSRQSAACLPAELHVYEGGRHGFGMTPHNLPVDNWTSALEAWMKSHGWMQAAATSGG